MYFLDTNILLKHLGKVEKLNKFYISSITLQELEDIKTSGKKSEDVRYAARRAVRWLNENENKYECILYSEVVSQPRDDSYNDDCKIIQCCVEVIRNENEPVTFLTDDLLCKLIAQREFGVPVESWANSGDTIEYSGVKEIYPSENELAFFYENLGTNYYDLNINQYLIIKDRENDSIIDTLKWNGEKHVTLFKKSISSTYFDKLKPKDIYQACAIDSLMTNTLTVLTGKAGTGKSLISLMVAMHLIESGKYDRLIIMFNPTKARGASDLGFYSGDFCEKAMQNSIGQTLITKFGDRLAIDFLLQQEKIKLVSMADVRGMEVKDSEILWITECQNTSIDLVKLCLSRVSSGAKILLEGDYKSQVDSYSFEGENNGLRRVIECFQNHSEFGYVQLKNVWRSKIAELCELL